MHILILALLPVLPLPFLLLLLLQHHYLLRLSVLFLLHPPSVAVDMEGLEAKDVLRKRIRVELCDRRVFEGTFVCLDKVGNIILTNCKEFRRDASLSSDTAEKEREGLVTSKLVPLRPNLPQILCPGEGIVKIEALMPR